MLAVPPLYVSLTFFCELLVYDKLPMSEVVQYWTKICGISIDEICSCLILLSEYRNEAGTVKWYWEKYSFFKLDIEQLFFENLDFFACEKSICDSMFQPAFFSVSELSCKYCSSITLAEVCQSVLPQTKLA